MTDRFTFEDELDEVDASIFTGDTLQDKESQKKLFDFCCRWLRELHKGETNYDSIKKIIKELEENSPFRK